MHERLVPFIRLPATCALAAWLCLSACENTKTTGPNPDPADYVVYFSDGTSDRDYFSYHPQTGVLDSFKLPHYTYCSLQASADGKRLYVGTTESVEVIDLASLESIASWPHDACGLAVSHNNQYVATLSEGLRVYETSGHTMVYEDTTFEEFWCCYSSDDRYLYLWGGYDPFHVRILEVSDGYRDTVREFGSEVSLLWMVPSVDNRKWFLMRQDRYNSRFEVYDVATDSIIFREYLMRGGVDIEVSPDGKYAFYTEMGDLTTSSGPSHFTIYDVDRNRISRLVSTVGILDGLNPSYWPLGEIVITPDSRWLIAGRSVGDPSFIRFNITTMEIDHYVQLTDNDLILGLTCQNAP